MIDSQDTNDILYGELTMLQPRDGKGPRVSVDTVLLADFARPNARARIIEMGCAHGAISLIIARRRARSWPDRDMPVIDAFDINGELVRMACENARMNDLDRAVRFFEADLRSIRMYARAETYDAVIMNPPYSEPRASRHSPDPAVAAARTGSECTLSEVVASAKYLLKNGGKFYLVIRAMRLAELFILLNGHNVRPKSVRAVHPKPGRGASVVLVEAARNSGEGLIVEPPLFIYGEDGEYTPELLAAYRIDDGRTD